MPMLKFVRLCAAALFLFASPAAHGQAAVWDSRRPITLFQFGPKFERFVQNYYRRPSPKAAVAWFGKLDLARARRNTAATVHMPFMLIGFYARLAERGGGFATDLARATAIRRSSPHTAIAYGAIVRGRSPDRRAAIAILESSMSRKGVAFMRRNYSPGRQPPILTWVTNRPWKLDVYWACYFASGDPRYLRKVGEALRYWMPRDKFLAWIAKTRRINMAKKPEDRRPDELTVRRMIALPAFIFLRNNARKHPGIRPVLRQMARTDKGAGRHAAAAILRDIGSR